MHIETAENRLVTVFYMYFIAKLILANVSDRARLSIVIIVLLVLSVFLSSV